MPRLFSAVRVRTTTTATVSLAFALLLSTFIIVNAQRSDLRAHYRQLAQSRADDIALSFASGTLVSNIATPTGNESVAQIIDSNGAVVARSLNIENEKALADLHPGDGKYANRTIEHVGEGEGPFLVIARGVTRGQATYSVLVAVSLEPLGDTTQTLIKLFALIVPVLVLAMGIIVWFVTGRSLQPVTAIRREVESIELDELSRRVPVPDSNDEITHLAVTMNKMLQRLGGCPVDRGN